MAFLYALSLSALSNSHLFPHYAQGALNLDKDKAAWRETIFAHCPLPTRRLLTACPQTNPFEGGYLASFQLHLLHTLLQVTMAE